MKTIAIFLMLVTLMVVRAHADEFGFPKPIPNQTVYDVVALVDCKLKDAPSHLKDTVFLQRAGDMPTAMIYASALRVAKDGRHRLLMILVRKYGPNGEQLSAELKSLPAVRVRR